MQSLPPTPACWTGFQLVYDTGVLDGLHTHAPSDAASVPPIHTRLPAALVTSYHSVRVRVRAGVVPRYYATTVLGLGLG